MGEIADMSIQDAMDCWDDDWSDHDPHYLPFRKYGPGECPRCGSITVLRNGKYGKFYGCTSYPDCRGTREFVSENKKNRHKNEKE